MNFEAKQEFIDELKQISDVIEVPAAQIIREAVSFKIAELKRSHPRLQQTEAAQLELSK